MTKEFPDIHSREIFIQVYYGICRRQLQFFWGGGCNLELETTCPLLEMVSKM